MYATWLARDQVVMSYLLKSMNPYLLAQVFGLEHAYEVWAMVEGLFSSQSHAQQNMLCGALSNTKKLDMMEARYLAKMNDFVS
jgi:hypothetical protein